MLSSSRARQLTVAAVVVLALLNGADAVTTHLLLQHAPAGAVEANPLAATLLASGAILYVKLAIVAAIGMLALHNRPRLGFAVGAWFVTGLYAAAVLSNILIIRML